MLSPLLRPGEEYGRRVVNAAAPTSIYQYLRPRESRVRPTNPLQSNHTSMPRHRTPAQSVRCSITATYAITPGRLPPKTTYLPSAPSRNAIRPQQDSGKRSKTAKAPSGQQWQFGPSQVSGLWRAQQSAWVSWECHRYPFMEREDIQAESWRAKPPGTLHPRKSFFMCGSIGRLKRVRTWIRCSFTRPAQGQERKDPGSQFGPHAFSLNEAWLRSVNKSTHDAYTRRCMVPVTFGV